MPLPLIALVAWGGGAMASIYSVLPDSVTRIAKSEFIRIAGMDLKGLENAAIKDVFAKMGLDIDPENGGLNAGAITDAINAGPLGGSGIELSNVFDKDALKRDLVKVALKQASDAFGLEINGLSLDDIKLEIKTQVSREVMEQVRAGAGELAESAKDLVDLVRQIDAYKKAKEKGEAGPNLLMTKEAINNRERQARYRAAHKRVWMDR